MYQAMGRTDKEMITKLLECALTTTITLFSDPMFAAARSFKVSEDLRAVSKLTDSFVVFVKKLYKVLPGLRDLSLTKQVDSQLHWV